MPTPSADIIQLFSVFSITFTKPTFTNMLVLLYGTILAPGRRTVTAALRAVGLALAPNFTNYHRVLNRARWSPWLLSQLLLQLIIHHCLSADEPVWLLIDETLERRRGEQIRYKGWFRDPIRSTTKFVVRTLGLRWVVLAVLVPVPWSQRRWALPFMSVPALSPKTSQALDKAHRSQVQWAVLMLARVRRWLPERQLVLVGDGDYAAKELIEACQNFTRPVQFVSTLRLDAALYHFPRPPQPGQAGPKSKKGKVQPKLTERLTCRKTRWQRLTVSWYGGQTKTLEVSSGTALWWPRRLKLLPIRWVLVRCPHNSFKPTAFFCSDLSLSPQTILTYFVGRWNLEVTFEEVRAHLGFETQRQWSDRAIERTTPCLLGLFSLVVLMAIRLHPHQLPIRPAAWYPKTQATFSDALAAVRAHLWRSLNIDTSSADPDMYLIPRTTLDALINLACYST
jgi:DDE superfamily endonuclease